MEKSTRNKILIGAGLLALLGIYIYKKKASVTTKPSTLGGGTTTNPKTPTTPSTPKTSIIPSTPSQGTQGGGKADPSLNPTFKSQPGGGGSGSGGGGSKGGGSVLTNTPDLSSGRMKKYDPNAKDENWIKANQKRQQKLKQENKEVCFYYPNDPSCIGTPKFDLCTYYPNDPSCGGDELYEQYYYPNDLIDGYEYVNDYNYSYNNYDNNYTYNYNYDYNENYYYYYNSGSYDYSRGRYGLGYGGEFSY
jgi:hypothetical protein